FFSSRRRHTRCLSDWSSDVCSSDLIEAEAALRAHDTTTWLSKLNIPRADATLLPVPLDTTYLPVTGTTLAPLTDPGTDAARAKRSEERRVGKECRSGCAAQPEKTTR